jgi:hypothetical protein
MINNKIKNIKTAGAEPQCSEVMRSSLLMIRICNCTFPPNFVKIAPKMKNNGL